MSQLFGSVCSVVFGCSREGIACAAGLGVVFREKTDHAQTRLGPAAGWLVKIPGYKLHLLETETRNSLSRVRDRTASFVVAVTADRSIAKQCLRNGTFE